MPAAHIGATRWLSTRWRGRARSFAGNLNVIPETCTEHVNGLYIEPRNVDDIAEKLCALLGNDALCESISKATVHSVQGRFDRYSVATRLDELCREATTDLHAG